MLVLFEAFYWLHFNNNVHGLGEWGVVCARTSHIDDTFLEAYDLTGGNNSSAFENVGSAFANGVNFSNPSWENAAFAFYFYARLDDVFNRCDSYAFTWTSEENFAGCDIFIFQSDFADFFFVNVQNAVFYFWTFVWKLNIVNENITEFQLFQSEHLLVNIKPFIFLKSNLLGGSM